MRTLGRSTLAGLALGGALAVCCCAQTDAPKFDVASVKPSAETNPRQSRFNRTPGGGLNAYNIPLRSFILIAYNVSEFELVGAPAWVESERYDIIAKPADPDVAGTVADTTYTEAAYNRLRLRLRALLAERFGLAAHRETRQMPVYALVAGNNGVKLSPSKENEATNVEMGANRLKCAACSLKMFAEQILPHQAGRPVVDRTGLTGNFTFELNFAPDAGSSATSLAGPSLLDAMQVQLGLKLESRKAPIEILVVDHVQRPSAN